MSELTESDLRKIKSILSDNIQPYGNIDDNKMRTAISGAVSRALSNKGYGLNQKREAAKALYTSIRGYDILQELIDDPQITDIMVNGPEDIFYEKDGRMYKYDKSFASSSHLNELIQRLLESGGKNISESRPYTDIVFRGGFRANAVLSCLAPDGPVLTIRKFTAVKPDMDSLIDNKFISLERAVFLEKQIKGRKNIFISGGTGTGKTTFLNVLTNFIPENDRIITIEDSPELQLRSRSNIVRLQARRSLHPDIGDISISDLVKCALRMRPDRIIIGEVRGEEAADMLWAMNSGHMGSLSTGHSNCAPDMLSRLCEMVQRSSRLPADLICAQISSAIDFVVHLKKDSDGRRLVDSIIHVSGYDDGRFTYDDI